MKNIIKIYLLLLKLYPKKYQKHYARQMVIVFKDMYQEELDTKGKISLIFLTHISMDVIISLANEYKVFLGEKMATLLKKPGLLFILSIMIINFVFFAPEYFMGKSFIDFDTPQKYLLFFSSIFTCFISLLDL